MLRIRLLLLLPLILLWLAQPDGLYAQDEAKPVYYRIELVDGSTIIGTIEQEEQDTIFFRTTSGVLITIPRRQIERMVEIQGRVEEEGRFVVDDPNVSRLLFAPTGRPLPKKTAYIANYELFFPFVAYGASSNLILAGGFSLIPGISEQLVYVTPKVTVYQENNTSIAVGTFLAGILGNNDLGGLVYGVATRGAPSQAVTVGLGFGFGGGDFEETPVFIVGGERQLKRNLKLLSENYIVMFDGVDVLFSVGLRFMGDRLTTDFALFSSPELLTSGFPFIPWLGFSYAFGR